MPARVNVCIGIQARSTSVRFPNKVFELIDGKPLLKHVIDSCEKSAAYMNRHADKHGTYVTVALLIPRGDVVRKQFGGKTMVIEGDDQDVLSRYKLLSDKLYPDYIVRVTGDCPLIPNYVITKLIKVAVLNQCDYVSNVDERFRTAVDGMDCEVMSRRMLEWVYEHASEQSDREHVTTLIRKSPPAWAKVHNVVGFFDFSNVKLSVDTPEDLERVREHYSKIKNAIEEGERIYGKSSVHRF